MYKHCTSKEKGNVDQYIANGIGVMLKIVVKLWRVWKTSSWCKWRIWDKGWQVKNRYYQKIEWSVYARYKL